MPWYRVLSFCLDTLFGDLTLPAAHLDNRDRDRDFTTFQHFRRFLFFELAGRVDLISSSVSLRIGGHASYSQRMAAIGRHLNAASAQGFKVRSHHMHESRHLRSHVNLQASTDPHPTTLNSATSDIGVSAKV